MLNAVFDALYTRPDFLIIGAQKCGTTALYDYLSQHPQVLPAKHKEIHYFDYGTGRGELWYRRRFPTQRQMQSERKRLNLPVITGEASPSYMLYPKAAPRAAAFVPRAKLLVLLRNPVDRAWSHFHMNVAKKVVYDPQQKRQIPREPLSFEDALAQEEARLQSALAQMESGGLESGGLESGGDEIGGDERSLWWRMHSYRKRGLYASQIKRWLEFFPPQQFLFVDSAELHRETDAVFNRVLDFLQLQPLKLPVYEPKLVGSYKETMKPETRRQLVDFYKPHNEELYALLGRRFDWDR